MRKRLLLGLLLCLLLGAGCGDRTVEEEKWELIEARAVTFADGGYADLWQGGWSVGRNEYRLPDGTVLLSVARPIGPKNVHVQGQEGFQDLNETAQAAVLAFYENQGLLYDVPATCEQAYGDYLDCREKDKKFDDYYLEQSIAPTASNARIMCFLTSVILPQGGQIVEELRLGAVFDRETGEAIGVWDLFALPERDAFERLMELSGVSDPALRAEMKAALRPEFLILFPNHLEISFPAGTLPSQEHSYGMGIDYPDLRGVLLDWAVPTPHQ